MPTAMARPRRCDRAGSGPGPRALAGGGGDQLQRPGPVCSTTAVASVEPGGAGGGGGADIGADIGAGADTAEGWEVQDDRRLRYRAVALARAGTPHQHGADDQEGERQGHGVDAQKPTTFTRIEHEDGDAGELPGRPPRRRVVALLGQERPPEGIGHEADRR